jgi:hypothetical protein
MLQVLRGRAMLEERAKQCRHCAQLKPLSEYARKSSAKDGLQSYCRECTRVFYVAHYGQNRERIVARNSARIKKNRLEYRRIIWEYLLAHPCVDCGESDPIVLEFDHVRGDKSGDISNLARGEFTTKRLINEIEKCEVRCANCHRRKTALQFGWFRPMDEIEGP